jgi:cellulose synthase/poly-beta-1,6-N-acetylglucosamine synthase-like glycosyltransferase
VFDADQVPNADFFTKTVPMLDGGQDVAMVLTPQVDVAASQSVHADSIAAMPLAARRRSRLSDSGSSSGLTCPPTPLPLSVQAFYNLNAGGDIFNHANVHFWDYTQPGYDALGLISCTGTNFLLRARAFQSAGWFPEWTLTEDFALGIELKRAGWQCRYVDEYLAIGEAPEEVRNCFQQRSRWAKGHFQVREALGPGRGSCPQQHSEGSLKRAARLRAAPPR